MFLRKRMRKEEYDEERIYHQFYLNNRQNVIRK